MSVILIRFSCRQTTCMHVIVTQTMWWMTLVTSAVDDDADQLRAVMDDMQSRPWHEGGGHDKGVKQQVRGKLFCAE